MSAESISDREALDFHSLGRPGKIQIVMIEPMAKQSVRGLAYSPEVVVSVLAIAADASCLRLHLDAISSR